MERINKMNKTVKENIVELLVKGHTDEEIAEMLKISKHTIKSVVAVLERKYMVKHHKYLAYHIGYEKGRNDS